MTRLNNLLVELASSSDVFRQLFLDWRLRKALAAWVKERRFLDPDMDMPDIADSLGCSREQLSYYCSRHLHMPFLTWRKQLRIEEAKRLMAECPEKPLSVIATEVGIKSPSNFRSQFREVEGCTPAHWRAQAYARVAKADKND